MGRPFDKSRQTRQPPRGERFSDLSAQTGQTVSDLVVLEQAFVNAGLGADINAEQLGRFQKALSGMNEEGGKTTRCSASLFNALHCDFISFGAILSVRIPTRTRLS